MARTSKRVFSPEEEQLIADAALHVFHECAFDLLTAIAEEKGKGIYDVTVSRPTAIEIALDAGRTEDHLRHSRNALVTPDFLERYKNADYRYLQKVARLAFVHTRYGI